MPADPNVFSNRFHRRKLLTALPLVVFAACTGGGLFFNWRKRPVPANSAPHEKWLLLVEQTRSHLDRQAWVRWQQMNDFLRRRRDHLPGLVDRSMSLNAKWHLLRGNLAEHLRSAFEEEVFSSDELEQVIRQTIEDYLRDIESAENRLLVSLRVDVMDLSHQEPDPVAELGRGIEVSAPTLKSGGGHVAADAGIDLTTLTVSELSAILTIQILRATATRMGISSVILSGSAATSGATFGISLVAGLIIDYWVSLLLRSLHDPRLVLLLELEKEYDRLTRTLLYGESLDSGLMELLRNISNQRLAKLTQQLNDHFEKKLSLSN